MRRSTLNVQRFVKANNRTIGHLFPRELRARVRNLLLPPRMELLIDVAGACNLRCPSCPVGNTGTINPKGLVDADIFRRIIEKAARDYEVFQVSLFNWGEPLLYPQLPELVSIVRSHGLSCLVSSNLNMVRRLD